MTSPESDRNPRILMIEDDQDLCDGWKDLFDMLGYEHRCYVRAQAALEDLEWIRTASVVISDYYLPDLNGVELIRRVRAIDPGMPVIILTGSKEAGVAQAVKSLPGCVLLHKPVNIDRLEQEILKLCASSARNVDCSPKRA